MKKVLIVLAVAWIGSVMLCPAGVLAQTGENLPKAKEFRIERSMPEAAVACIGCHRTESPGLFADWSHSRHAAANITCLDCHQADAMDTDVSAEHYKQYERSDQKYGIKEYKVPVAAVVTPKDCSRCHQTVQCEQTRQYHGNYLEDRSMAHEWNEQ
jgi:hydroxylamine dehydrogenase